MANFASLETAVVASLLEFVEVSENSIQQFKCTGGEIAGFRIQLLDSADGEFAVSQIFNCTTGTPILQGTVSVVPGLDLTGGLFSSGCFSDGDPLDEATRFYRVDYE